MEGRKGKLAVVAEVYEVAPELAVVELSFGKFGENEYDGDEYAERLEESEERDKLIRPNRKDVSCIFKIINNGMFCVCGSDNSTFKAKRIIIMIFLFLFFEFRENETYKII